VKKNEIIFLLAMDYEIKNVFDLKEYKKTQDTPFRVLIHKKHDILVLRTGMGKANAAAATQFALDRFNPVRIINIGLAGCANKKIAIGEVRAISEIKFFDVDATAFGYKLGQIPKCKVASYRLTGQETKQSKIISGDSFVNDCEKFSLLAKTFSFGFIDMESGGIAHTLYINKKLNILECYKVASDYADASAAKDFYENEKIAFKNLKDFVNSFLSKK
jgi:adenosylhomocysteine nucleosidase